MVKTNYVQFHSYIKRQYASIGKIGGFEKAQNANMLKPKYIYIYIYFLINIHK